MYVGKRFPIDLVICNRELHIQRERDQVHYPLGLEWAGLYSLEFYHSPRHQAWQSATHQGGNHQDR